MQILVIARVAHLINAAYCASLGDTSQTSWEDAPEWQRESAVNGVNMHLANPDATPEQSHESWLAQKVEAGWVYGDVKDADAKTHPCCVPFAELKPEQKAKDFLFRGVVHALKDIPDAEEAVAEAVAALTAKLEQAGKRVLVTDGVGAGFTPGSVGVKYIGRRESWKDTVYHSGVTFEKDQERGLPAVLARKLLRHADLFEQVELTAETAEQGAASEADDMLSQEKINQAAKQKTDLEFDTIAQVNQMTKAALEQFSQGRFGVKLDSRLTVAQMREQVTQNIHKFGAE